MPEPILSLVDVHAGYDGVPVVFGVSLEVMPGELVAVVGGQRGRQVDHHARHCGPQQPPAGALHHPGSNALNRPVAVDLDGTFAIDGLAQGVDHAADHAIANRHGGNAPGGAHLHAIFDTMGQRLGTAVPDLGRHTAGDATSLNARRKQGKRARAEEEQGLPQASGGRKEYTDDAGQVTKIVEWFGFKLHLLVDVKHEVSLAYKITDTKAGDGETLPAILADAQANLPASRIQTLAYDKAADNNDVHKLLSKHHIRPVIQNRSLWKDHQEEMLPGHDGNSNIVYDEAGTVYCYDRVSEPMVRHRMGYIGYEPARETIKYRCPIFGAVCPDSRYPISYCLTSKRFLLPREYPALFVQPKNLFGFPMSYLIRISIRIPLQKNINCAGYLHFLFLLMKNCWGYLNYIVTEYSKPTKTSLLL